MGSLRNNKYYSGFDPRNIPDCAVWLDATDVNANGTQPATGTAVSTWVNKAGSSNFTTISGSTSPTISNGGVYFTGTLCGLASSSNVQTTRDATFCMLTSYAAGNTEIDQRKDATGFALRTFASSLWQIRDGAGNLQTSPSFSVNSNTRVLKLWRDTLNLGQGYINGVLNYTASGTYNQTVADTGTIRLGQHFGQTYGATFTIFEVIIFNRYVTDAERFQLEGYLSWKWGVVPSLQIPTSISGLTLWLDAADTNSLVLSGSTVTQWRDKSGNGRNATGGVSPSYSNNGVVFNGTSTYLSTTYSAVPSAESVFVVVTWTGTVDRNYCIIGTSASNGRNYNVFKNAGSNVIKWDKWGVAGYAETPGVQSNVRFLSAGLFNGTTGSTNLNGGSQNGPVSFSFSGTGTTNIGTGVLSDYYQGTINEIICYNSSLSVSDRQRIEGYLADKWGLRANLPGTFPTLFPTSHPFYRSLPYTRAFNPLDIGGCTLWLDGADGGSMTLSGSNITTWRDKSGNGCNATASGTPVFVQNALASNSVVSFNGTSYFTGSQTNTGTTQSTIAVVRFNSGGPQFARLASFGVNGSFDYNSASYYNLSSNTTQFAITRNSVETDVSGLSADAYHIVTAIFDGTNGLYYVDGGMTSNSAAWSSAFNYNQYRIGADQIPTTAQQLQGSIGEILTYSNALSTTERQQVERYLGWKWNISNQIQSPRDIGTLALWMDAADSNTLTLSGANVTAWRDKGANNLPLTLVGTPTWTSNSVNFTGTQYFTNTTISLNLSAMTVFLVGYTFVGAQNAGFLSFVPIPNGVDYNQSNAISYTAYSNVAATMNTTFNYTTSLITPSYTSPTNPFLFAHVQNGTSMTLYGLGTSFYSTTTNFTPGTTTGLTMGARYQNGNGTVSAYLTGNIKEIIVYNTALSIAQRQQVEKYLARKWGLTGNTNIPSSTLSLDIPPRISSYAPPQASNLSVWLDAADATQVSLSGSNVSAWLDKSSNGLSMQSGASPTYVSNSLNGLPTIAFTTTQNLSSTTTLTLSPSNTWAVVFNAPSGGNYFMAEHSSNINNVQGSYFSGTNFDLYAMNRTGVLATWKRYQDSSGQGVPPFNPNTWYIAIVSDNNLNGGVFFRRNGVTRTISNVNTYTSLTGNITSNFFVNHRLSAAVNIAELLVYNRGLSLAEVQVLEGYLASKWGLFSSLPTTHPYAKITP